jgi:hypothetical protein
MNWFKSSCVVLVAAGSMGLASAAFAADNGVAREGGAEVILATPTRGQVLCTAAINPDGSVAQCYNCSKDPTKTFKIAPGQYQVSFLGICDRAEADKGWSRWVQVDTLTIGTSAGSCTTADRVGVPAAVWVDCRDSVGNQADLSFFLFLAK